MDNVRHLPYMLDQTTKFSYYENLWKSTCLELINKYVPEGQRATTRILDVGSGRGEMMQLLVKDGYLVEGFDNDQVCVDLSSKFGVCKQGDVENIESYYPQKDFDIVISLHVIEHLDNPKKCIERFANLSTRYILLATPNLSSLPFLNLSRNIASCNNGHRCGWNYSHLKNLIQNILRLEIVEWAIDCVRIYDYLPYLGPVDFLVHKSGLRALIEERILKRLFPRLSNSLIVLAKLPGSY